MRNAAATRTRVGPLTVSARNPRYFGTVDAESGAERAVYLTGSHIWNNLHDGMGPGAAPGRAAEVFDYPAYLRFLTDRGHNFIRLWRWEHVASQAAGGAYHLWMDPQPWARPGPGTARDGRPRFDLTMLDQTYFDRLRRRIVAAGDVGIYVAVMLFDGFALHLTPQPDNIAGHPFAAGNNVNDVAIESILDYQVDPLPAAVRRVQDDYVRKVVDTVHDLPNVLYEVANESSGATAEQLGASDGLPCPVPIGDSTTWQYRIITLLKEHERRHGYEPRPVGMTMQYPVPDQRAVNEVLLNSPADWISPGFDDAPRPGAGRWLTDPPVGDATKVVLSDTDHYAAGRGDPLWAWKTFLRGHNPVLMDFGLIDGPHPADPGVGAFPFTDFEPARYAMGCTRVLADRVDLLAMTPRPDLSSTGYALAHVGHEYLVLHTGTPSTVDLQPGTYRLRWHRLTAPDAIASGTVTVPHRAAVPLRAPVTGPVVAHLRRTGP